MSALLIDNATALEPVLDALRDAAWLALDTEFLRERTYYPKLCLLQIGAPHAAYFVDTLACSDSARLSEFLAGARQIKIIHAARQDLEALSHAGICTVQPIFDTQVAAALIGHLNLTHPNSIQVLGGDEASIFDAFAEPARADFVAKLFSGKLTAVIVADGVSAPPEVVAGARSSHTPLFATPLAAPRVIESLSRYLAKALAETTTRHGVFIFPTTW